MQTDIPIPPGLRLSADHALYIRADDTLAIGDLHLGYEGALQAEHITIPRFQLASMLKQLEQLLDRYRPRRVIINGDMKHDFSRNQGQEWDEVEAVLDMLGEQEIIVIRGNHDNYLQTILARRNLRMVDHFELPASRIMFLHGHRELESRALKVYSHEHPVLRFRDEVGAQVTLPCFLFDEENNILVMPAFSPLTSGTNVISPEDSFMSPGLRELDLGHARIFVILDGIMEFGRVGDLRDMLNEASFQAMIKNRRSSFQ